MESFWTSWTTFFFFWEQQSSEPFPPHALPPKRPAGISYGGTLANLQGIIWVIRAPSTCIKYVWIKWCYSEMGEKLNLAIAKATDCKLVHHCNGSSGGCEEHLMLSFLSICFLAFQALQMMLLLSMETKQCTREWHNAAINKSLTNELVSLQQGPTTTVAKKYALEK